MDNIGINSTIGPTRYEMLLYCLRHGQTVYNAEGRVQGQTDVPLSELGRVQSQALADAMAAQPITALYCSPLARAMETAQPLAERLHLPIRTDPRLMEIHLGQLQGQVRAEFDRRHPELIARWKSGDPDFAFPGGESRRAMTRRALAAFEAIRQTAAAQVAVVTHGALLLAVIRQYLHTPPDISLPPLENASISVLACEGPEVRVLRLNDVGHLHGIELSGGGDL